MSNKDCASVYSTTDAIKKNLLQRVFSSTAQLFSSTKAKYKHNQKTYSAPTKSLLPLPSPNHTHKTAQYQLSPPCIANDVQSTSRSAYEADPIFTALDANDVPDLTLFISGENKPTCAQKKVPTIHPDLKEVPMAIVSTPISQTGQNHVITDAITPCDISAMASTVSSRLTSPPPTPTCPVSSSTLLFPKRASSLTSSSASRILSVPSSPSSTDLQFNLRNRIPNAADFETGVRAIEREEILALKGSRIKRSNSLSLSISSSSSSAYAGTPSDNNLPNLPSLRTPELPPVLDVSQNDRGQLPIPDMPGASDGSCSYVISSPLLPRCSNRRGSNETEHEKEDISNRKAKVNNNFDSTNDTVKPDADFANVLASPPASHIEKRRLFESNKLTIDSKADCPSGQNLASHFTISACRQFSLSASNTRRPVIPFFPNSQVTPPPTPTFSVPQPSPRSTKMKLSSVTELQNRSAGNVDDLNVTGARNDANANAAKIASCTEHSKSPRLRSSYCKKIEYNETSAVAPNLISGIDGDFGRVWRGYDRKNDNEIEERSDDDEVKSRYNSVPLCQNQEVGTLIWKNVESG